MVDFVFTDPQGIDHTVTGPEGATQEQAFQILQRQLPKQSSAPAQPKPELPPQPREGKNFTDVMTRATTQNPLSTGVQATAAGANAISGLYGKAADVATDVLGKGYQKVMEQHPEAEKLAEKSVELVKGGLQKAAASSLGQELIGAAKKGALAYVDLAKQHPEAARDVEALVDIGKFIAASKAGGEQVIKAPLKAAGEASFASPIMAGMGKSAEDMKPITERLHQKATGIIERAKGSGATLTANLPEDAKKEISSIAELSTSGDIANAKQTNKQVQDFLDSISPKEVKNAKGIKEEAPGDFTLRNLLGHRQAFDTIATNNAGSAESIAAKKVSGSIEKIIDDALKNDEIKVHNKQDVEALGTFKSAWSKYKQHKSLVSALENSEESSSKARNAMAKIRDSKFFNSYPPEAQKYINIGAKGRTRGAILDAVGKLKKIANFKNLGWAELAATILHSPSLAVGAAGVSAAAHMAEAGGKKIVAGDIRKAIKSVEKQK